jgi:hypothetical protein
MSDTPNDIFKSMRLAADVLEKLHQEIVAMGGSDEDFMSLLLPNVSRKLIRKIAEHLLPSSVELLLRRWSTVPIEELELTVRAYNSLKGRGFDYVSQLLTCTEYDLLAIPYFGRACLENAKQALRQKDLQLAE